MASSGTGTEQSCALCGASPVVWGHPLAEGLVGYREHGKGHTLPTLWALCDGCEQIYASGDDDAAVEVMRSSEPWSYVADEDVAECVRQPLMVFRRADLGARRVDPEPAAVVDARKHGFVPLRQLTGAAAHLGPLWPETHALWLDELGPSAGEDEHDETLDRWLVRSPWASLAVRQTLGALWCWVERGPDGNREPEAAYDGLVLEFFALPEPEVVALADLDEDT